ncbi:hypothetical protein Scep_005720 [Stephania cephalantha]|uniref:Uncharacterized protein n=1 Tax=Stephania cephalantha TaxID=152367 RepID=A0AAP0Q0E4_9MAGN
MAGSNAAIAVDVKEITVITPSEATPSHVLPLSTLDSQLFLRFTIEYLFLYRSPNNNNHSRHHTSARLKDALSRALVPYYPLAGRVRPRPHSHSHSHSHSPSSSKSSASPKAPYSSKPPAAPSPTSSSTAPSLPLSLPQPPLPPSPRRRPLLPPPLILQLTWLPDGGAALALAFNHCIIDGIGTSLFLNSFADLASGRSRLSDLLPLPVWDRHLPSLNSSSTTTPTPLTSSRPHPEFLKLPDPTGFAKRFSQEALVPTSVVFDAEKIAGMKKMAVSGGSKGGGYTGFEVVSGWVWRSWAGALGMEVGTVRMVFSVNVRGRVVGPGGRGQGYYGNAFVLGCAAGRGREVVGWGGGAAEAVRRAKEAAREEAYVREVVEAVGAGACPDTVGVLVVSQWSRLGLDRVDFGMGRPLQVAPLSTDRYCLILPVYGQRDAVRVVVALPSSAVPKYDYLVRNPTR